MGAIAKKLARSSRTVYEVLTDRRRRPLPDAGRDVQYEDSRKHKQGGQHRRRRNPNGQKPEIDFDFPRTFMKTLGPKLVRDSFDLMQKDPEFVRQLVGSVMGVDIPRRSLDDVIHDEISSNPDLIRQLAEVHLEHMKRNGRAEMDIVGEGQELLLRRAKELNSDSWPKVLRDLGASGELTRIVGLWKGGVDDGYQHRSDVDTSFRLTPPEPDRTPSKLPNIPPVIQKRRHRYPSNPDFISSINAPLPDFSEQAAAVVKAKAKFHEPTDLEQEESEDAFE